MQLIIGLGNPGAKYEDTRHNIGFIFLNKLQKKWSFPDFSFHTKFQADLSQGMFRNEKVLLVKPQSFMNLSGETVRSLLSYYKLKAENLIVIHDDIDIPAGKAKISNDSTSAGHNGVQNIINLVGTKKFTRLRVGIRKIESEPERSTADYVLERMEKEELVMITNLIENDLLGKIEQLPAFIEGSNS